MAVRRRYEVGSQQALIELGSEIARIAHRWAERHGYEYAITVSTLEDPSGENRNTLKVVARKKRSTQMKQAEQLLKMTVNRVQQGDC